MKNKLKNKFIGELLYVRRCYKAIDGKYYKEPVNNDINNICVVVDIRVFDKPIAAGLYFDLYYVCSNSKFEVFITKNELRTAQSTYKYDLIITLSAQDLESLGDIFLNNTDLFYRVPVVNIDHRPSNEHFGQINLVDISATSSSEIIFKTLEQLNAAHIDEEIATALLTGMISQTRSFKTPNVNPDTLNLAGRLMNLGADREKIIRHLYYTKSLSTLKLWGQALSNLQNDRETGLAWTTVTREDFARSGASEDDLRELIHDLISNSPEIKMILIVFENSNDKKINCLLATEKHFDAMELAKSFSPSGDKKIAVFSISDKNLKEAEETAVAEIRNKAKFLLAGLN